MKTKSALLPAVPKVLRGGLWPGPGDPGAHATSRIAQPSPSAGVAGSILQAFRRAWVVQEAEECPYRTGSRRHRRWRFCGVSLSNQMSVHTDEIPERDVAFAATLGLTGIGAPGPCAQGLRTK